ncbi:hypothetical protein L1280_000349 [Deinococcus sp. HSC-46F16]|uniref:hypothetical protein n=1 Tax=Deinococcus sp. HSC-46F16 TaxID=2910968 RepID=UPI00209EAF3A|nr:hypothetical protein [Deinococcus sp. HSC-46F16]MCP2013221.1 hypothetical protein [Deinococcus sp. HSC-46F16]
MPVRISTDAVKNLLHQIKGVPGVYVLRAPPGDGKTDAVIQALASLRSVKGLRRILYATHATLGENAVGREVQRRFGQVLSSKPEIVRGRKHFDTEEEYEKQFKQPWNKGIKIIAHAHLEAVFSTRPSKAGDFLRHAELLVVDEDPLFSLLVRSSEDFKDVSALRCDALFRLAAPDPFTHALVALWTDIKAHLPVSGVDGWNSWGDSKARPDRHSLTGEAFWEHIAERMPEYAAFDRRSFEGTLAAINSDLSRQGREERLPVSLVAQALEEDLSASQHGQYSHRFGLFWKDDPAKATFRFDLRVPIALPCPVLVLDAYATQKTYDALFTPFPVRLITEFDRRLPLEIEVINEKPFTYRDFSEPERVKTTRAQVTRTVAELLDQSHQHVLVLAPQEFNKQSHPWTVMLTMMLELYEVARRAEGFHWWAGRGKNAWTGWHVVAVFPPYLPRTFRDHDLAALWPYSADARQSAMKHITQSELLQMLHRGRQPHFDGEHRPRVITFFDPDLPSEYWHRVPTQSSVTFEAGKQLDGWKDAVRVISKELLQVFGCVPVAALETLGLLPFRHDDLERQARQSANLRKGLQRAKTPELHHWRRTGQLKKYRIAEYNDSSFIGVRCYGGNDRAPLYQILQGMGLQRVERSRTFTRDIGSDGGIVFAPAGTTEADVLPVLRLLLAGTSTPGGQPSAASRNNSVGNQRECV